MSLVVADRIEGVPFLLGDVIISQQEKPKQSIAVPTIPDISRIMDISANQSIERLIEKVACLRRDVCVGWAGSVYTARQALEILDEHLPKQGTDAPMLEKLLASVCVEEDLHTRMLFWVGDRRPACLLWDSGAHDEIIGVDLPFVIGSGTGHMNTLYDAHSLSSGHDYVGTVLARAANVLSFELAYGLNLADLWGGTILPIIFSENSFRVYDDYMSFFFFVEERHNRDFESSLHPYIYRPLLVEDTCLLQRINWQASSVDYFAIPSILSMDRPIDRSDIPRSDHKPSYYSFSGMFRHIDGQNSPFAFVLPDRDASEYFRLEIQKGSVTFSYSNKFFSTLVDICKTIQKAAPPA